MSIACRGVRGATTVDTNTTEEILRRTRELLALMIRLNDIHAQDVASVFFTTTRDVTAEFPALAARQLGWLDVPLLCGHEMNVPGAVNQCVRVLLHWNTDVPQDRIQHVYVRGAVHLRPDKADLPPVDWDALDNWIERQLTAWHERHH